MNVAPKRLAESIARAAHADQKEESRRKDESYIDYIASLKASRDELAIAVKLADLRDHLRPNCPSRLRLRYEKAWLVLTGKPHSIVTFDSAGLCNVSTVEEKL